MKKKTLDQSRAWKRENRVNQDLYQLYDEPAETEMGRTQYSVFGHESEKDYTVARKKLQKRPSKICKTTSIKTQNVSRYEIGKELL